MLGTVELPEYWNSGIYSKQRRGRLFLFILSLSRAVFLPRPKCPDACGQNTISAKTELQSKRNSSQKGPPVETPCQPKRNPSQNGTPTEIKDTLNRPNHLSTMAISSVIPMVRFADDSHLISWVGRKTDDQTCRTTWPVPGERASRPEERLAHFPDASTAPPRRQRKGHLSLSTVISVYTVTG